MKQDSVFLILIKYLKESTKVIIRFMIFIIIYFLVYFLYDIPKEPALYATLLVVTLGFILFLYDFYKYYKKHLYLKNMDNNIEFELKKLYNTQGLIEKDYEDIISHIYEHNLEVLSKVDNNYSDMVDYYTMWVHQIKTPIAALSMMIQSMDSGDDKWIMEQEVFKIQQYVDMVLHYIRLDSLSSDLKLQKYSLSILVKGVVKKYAVNFIRGKITLNMEEFDNVVITDDKWISFVLEQVISNALKYTNGGCIYIYMDKDREDTLIIEDTGIGISEEDINRVFDKGFTGYNGRMDKKATGIGLYLCREILNKLSHNIYISSSVGEGTKVAIDFSTAKFEIE